ncbi:MAG: hypothetical protein Ta2A_19870 [Treponemataceae bacterium]|nr:MAG: hypothetical protein Ta2A_19870 [Treponemataceae bacterium]
MKRNILLALAAMCFTFSAYAQVYTLDGALTDGSLQAGAAIPRTAKILVISYETPSKLFSDYVGEVLTGDLEEKMSKDMIRYRNVDILRRTYRITNDFVSEEKTFEIAKALKADFVIFVTVTKRGSGYQINFQPINIAGGKRIQPVKYTVKEDALTTELSSGPPLSEETSAPTEGAVRRLRALRDEQDETGK